MNAKTTLPLVAVACFGLGVAADRVLLSGSEEAAGAAPTDGRPLPSATSAGALASEQRHEGPGPTPESDPIEEAFAQLDHDEGVDYQSAAALLESLPAGERREHLLHRIAERWARSNPEAALVWAESLEGRERRHAEEVVLHTWSEEDPGGALAFAAALPNSERSLNYVHHLAHEWAERDRNAAIAWGSAQDDVAVRARALRGAVEAWASEDPFAAGEFAMGIDNAFERRELLEMVGHRWADRNRTEATNWAANLDGEHRSTALRAVLNQIGEAQPGDAAMFYDTLSIILPDRDLRDAAGDVAARWAESAPADAAEWALGLPEEHRVQRRAVHEVVQHWLHLDSIAASEWVGTLPAGETRDAAAGTLVEHVARSDPESAFAWAVSIDEEGHRTHLMHHSLERWNEVDPAAARAAFDTASLNADQRRHLGELFDLQSTPATSP
jgi:hypothetical protein